MEENEPDFEWMWEVDNAETPNSLVHLILL
jgi:hypothetical protein